MGFRPAPAAAGGGSPVGIFRSGRYYPSGLQSATGTGVTAGRICRVNPLIVGRTTTFDRIAVVCHLNSVGSRHRIGIYNSTVFDPGALVFASGLINTDVAAGVAVEEVIAVTLDPGIYWLCASWDTDPASDLRVVHTSTIYSKVHIVDPGGATVTTTGLTEPGGLALTSLAGAALPDPAPAVVTVNQLGVVRLRAA